MSAAGGGRGEGGGTGGAPPDEHRGARLIGVGCFTAFAGTWSGAMVAVLLGMIIESARGSPDCTGVPICNWYVYAGVGALVGAITLPFLALRRLRRSAAENPNS